MTKITAEHKSFQDKREAANESGATPHKNARHSTEMPHENVNLTLSNRNKHLYFTTHKTSHVTSCDQN